MLWALAVNGARIEATRGTVARCPQCGAELLAKCGTFVVHHWAHRVNDCDPWWEPETPWHRDWKARVPVTWTEVTRNGHRADIVRPNGVVVELQHSTLDVTEIAQRERAYGRMIWLFDATDLPTHYPDDEEYADSTHRLLLRAQEYGVSFRWKHPRKHITACRMPVFLDLGRSVLRLRKLHLDNPPYGGYGTLGTPEQFTNWLLRCPAPLQKGITGELAPNAGLNGTATPSL